MADTRTLPCWVEDAPPPLHALHGRQPQRQRDATLAKFTDAEGTPMGAFYAYVTKLE